MSRSEHTLRYRFEQHGTRLKEFSVLDEHVRRRLRRIRDEVKWFYQNTLGRPRLFKASSHERLGVVFRKPSDMCEPDKIMIYALVRGLRPERALEIGVRWGGSARIIASAMEDNGIGKIVGLDPDVEPFRPAPSELFGRYQLVQGFSPQDVPRAIEALGGKPDFVFIDALHTHDAVFADFNAVLPFLAPGSHVLFHDTYHQGIDTAIREVMAANPGFVDCGILTRNPEIRLPVLYQGLRLLRFGDVEVDNHALMTEACVRNGVKVPSFHPYYNNWDEWANGIGLGVQGEPPTEE
jgi:predicted O-methyltransferase YrrM